MEMENTNLVPATSQTETQKRSGRTEELIKEWLFRFGVEHKEDVAPKLPLWLEAFGGMDPEKLHKLFVRAIQTCKFFPKISEILQPCDVVATAYLDEQSERAWQKILDYRRRFWNPDMPGGFSSSAPRLSDRMETAARAAGIFRDFDTVEALHTWAKKAFIESYQRYGELKRDEYLMPPGEVKNLILDLSKKKSLPEA
jgi:hypothetical protein